MGQCGAFDRLVPNLPRKGGHRDLAMVSLLPSVVFHGVSNDRAVCMATGGRVQELCESRSGRPRLSVLMSLTVSVDVKQHRTMLRHWSQFVPNMSTDIRGYD